MHQQEHLLSCQLRPAFPPAWKECGAIRFQTVIVHQTERTVWDQIRAQATDSASANQAFLLLSPERSDIAREHHVILPIKRECVCVLEALLSGAWRLVSA